jgi:ABC-2 type transport system ATP-binding protein
MPDNCAIETTGLGRRYGSRWVVQDLGLQVKRGAVYGFLGLNGAGKSTTIRMLMGLIRRHGGNASVLGLDPQKSGVEIKRRVGYVAEMHNFYGWMKVQELCDFVATYRQGEWKPKLADDYLRRFRIPTDTKVKDLSKGQRAKTALVLAMAFDPEMLILDEPTGGLDPLARREFVEGILAEYQEAGKTIFVSSHLVNEISGLVDHVGIIHEGGLLYSGRVEEFLSSVQRVQLCFDDKAPHGIACEGMLRCQTTGRDAMVSVRDFDEDRTLPELKRFNPSSFKVERLNLEDAFVEFIAGTERGAM